MIIPSESLKKYNSKEEEEDDENEPAKWVYRGKRDE
jgi:hypothetical protein